MVTILVWEYEDKNKIDKHLLKAYFFDETHLKSNFSYRNKI